MRKTVGYTLIELLIVLMGILTIILVAGGAAALIYLAFTL